MSKNFGVTEVISDGVRMQVLEVKEIHGTYSSEGVFADQLGRKVFALSAQPAIAARKDLVAFQVSVND